MISLRSVKIEGLLIKFYLLGIKIVEQECEDEVTVRRLKNIWMQPKKNEVYIRDIDSKGNIVDKEV
jgi:hypothetical protein